MLNNLTEISSKPLTWTVAATVGAVSLAASTGATTCPVYLTTGVPCPGCGMSRAGVSLVKGDVAGAFDMHPLIFVVALLAIVGAVILVLPHNTRTKLWQKMERFMVPFSILFAASLILVWVVRFITGTLPF